MPIVLLDKKLYPAGGATRLSSMLNLQLPIKYILFMIGDLAPVSTPKVPSWPQLVVTADSPSFEALSRGTKEQFFSWKKQWEEEYYEKKCDNV